MLKQTVSSKIKSLTRTVFERNTSRLKKMLFVTGFLVLGMCLVGQNVYAEASMTQADIWSQGGKTRVKLSITGDAADFTGYVFDNMTIKAAVSGNEPGSNPQECTVKETNINADGTVCDVVVELPGEGTYKLSAEIPRVTEGDPLQVTMVDQVTGVVANSPRVKEGTLLKYYSPEYGEYIQAQFVDDCKITKITDVDGKDRLELTEKEQANTVTLKYILNKNEKTFRIHNENSNSTVVDISDAVEVTFNARTRDGSRFVLGVSETIGEAPNKYELISIKTGAGQDIDYHSDDNMYGKKEKNDNEDTDDNEIVGVTKLVLTYKKIDGTQTMEIELPLILDKTTPEVVGYVAIPEGDGTYTIEKVKANIRNLVTSKNRVTTFRAYVNNTTDKCIVEVRDVQSGIDTIKLLKGAKGAYKLIEETASTEEQKKIAKNAGYDSHGKVIPSVLHLFSFEGLKDRVTAVRVTDGLGNKTDIEVKTSTVDDEDTIIFAKLEEYKDNGKTAYRVIAQDYKAGLWKIERDTDVDDIKQVLVNFESPKADGLIVEEMVAGVPTQVEKANIENWLEVAGQKYEESKIDDLYRQYTVQRVIRRITEQGQPTIMIYDALGNARQVSFDDIAFACYYATYNKDGSLAISLKETRGIWKITAGIVSPTDAQEEPKYTAGSGDKMGIAEVPVDSNEPLYEGEVPNNGLGTGEEFFGANPEGYKAELDNRPKYIASNGNLYVPNNGLNNGTDDPEFFETTGANMPAGYDSSKDNRPMHTIGDADNLGGTKGDKVVPNNGLGNVEEIDGTPVPEIFETTGANMPAGYDLSKDNRPKYNGEVPSYDNEPKYNGLVPSDGTGETIDNRPKYKGALPGDGTNGVADNRPKYNFGGTLGEKVPVDPSDGAEPKYCNEKPIAQGKENSNEPEANTDAHQEWQAAYDAHEVWVAARALEASDRAVYDTVWAEYQLWEAAYNAYNDPTNGWLAKKAVHDTWSVAMNEYQTWLDVLADYKEWKAVRDEYLEWKVANAEHIAWKAAEVLHTEWENNIKTYTLEVFRDDNEPNKLIKTYQVPDGVVQKVTVYHTHGRNDLCNEITSVAHSTTAALQDVTELTDEEVIFTTKKDIAYKRTMNGAGENGYTDTLIGATIRASRGIKLIDYVDGTIVEFNKDLPTELFVNCECVSPKGDDGEIATVVDSVGCQLKIYSSNITYNTFNQQAEAVPHNITFESAVGDHDAALTVPAS